MPLFVAMRRGRATAAVATLLLLSVLGLQARASAQPVVATTLSDKAPCPRLLAGTSARDRWRTRSEDGQSVLVEPLAGRKDFIPGLLDGAALQTRQEHLRRGLIVDAETIGLRGPVAIEVALLPFLYDHRDGAVVSVLEPYVGTRDPGVPLPDLTVHLTGLTDDLVRGTRFDERRIADEFRLASIVIAHNAEFDRPIFDGLEALSGNKPWGCSLKDVDWYGKGFPSRSLEALVLRHGFWERSHRALADGRQTLRLLSTRDEQTGRAYLAELLGNARRKEREIAVTVPYAYRPQLKDRGYQWDRRRGVWFLNVPKEGADAREAAERAWYEAEASTVRNRGFKGFEAREVDAKDRYRTEIVELPDQDPSQATGIAPPEPLPLRAPTDAQGRYQLRLLPPLGPVDRSLAVRWKATHRKAVPAVIARAVATGREKESDSLVEVVLIPILLDPTTGAIIAAATPYHGYQAPKKPLSAKAQERLGLTDAVLAGRTFDVPQIQRWLAVSRYVIAYDAEEERPWLERLAGSPDSKARWISLKSDVPWSARGDVKTFFEPLFARHGFFVDGPDALSLATGLFEVLRTEDSDLATPLLDALARAEGVYVRVAVEEGPYDAGDAYRANGLKFHKPSKRWERVVPNEVSTELVLRLRQQFPLARIVGELLQPEDRYRER